MSPCHVDVARLLHILSGQRLRPHKDSNGVPKGRERGFKVSTILEFLGLLFCLFVCLFVWLETPLASLWGLSCRPLRLLHILSGQQIRPHKDSNGVPKSKECGIKELLIVTGVEFVSSLRPKPSFSIRN